MREPFVRKEYERQKKLFHGNPFNYNQELHHIWGRIGVFLGCPRFLIAGDKGHHKNIGWLKIQRSLTQAEKLIMQNNYVKGLGCEKDVFEECRECLIRKAYKEF